MHRHRAWGWCRKGCMRAAVVLSAYYIGIGKSSSSSRQRLSRAHTLVGWLRLLLASVRARGVIDRPQADGNSTAARRAGSMKCLQGESAACNNAGWMRGSKAHSHTHRFMDFLVGLHCMATQWHKKCQRMLI